MTKIRMHVTADLASGAEVAVEGAQAHYLFTVMRLGEGAELRLFNGRDGEWQARVGRAAKRSGLLECSERLRAQQVPPDLWLLFAPLKKLRTDFVAEKACELGCRRLMPVFTRFTNAERVNRDRLSAHAVEAAEQCGLLSVPEVSEPAPLGRVLDDWPDGRRLLFCDERGEGPPAATALADAGPGPWAVLIGPEGGFAPEEAAALADRPFAHAVSLGPRILRADTAAVAALALVQATVGDWR